MNESIDKAVQKRSGLLSVIRRGLSDDERLDFRVEFITAGGTRGYYSVRAKRDDTRAYIEREKCFVEGATLARYEAEDGILDPASARNWTIRPLELGYLYLPYMAAFPEFSPASDVIDGCEFYNFSPKDFRPPVSESKERVLRGDGSNLANVLYTIKIERPMVFERIVQYLSVVTPAIKEIELEELGGYRTIKFAQTRDSSFSSREISDGTLRSLAVLVALFQTAAGAKHVSLVGLEEPEAALHPAAAGVLFDALREASASVQVIATTHSADLLDKLDIDAKAILAVEMEEGITRIGRLDHTGREALRKRLYTPGELMRMNYLIPDAANPPNESEIESVLFGDMVSA